MTILNMMLGRKRGGLEQASLDYAEGLALAGIPALTLISPEAWVEAPLVAAGVPHESLRNAGFWDPIAAWRLRRVARANNATAIICHGNRALGLALNALKGRIPVIGVAHNYSNVRFVRADACFSITAHSCDYLAAQGCQNITLMPNMTRMPGVPPHGPFRAPPIIGSMGRFVPKKAFDVYIEALAILKQRGIPFRAILGGDGDQLATLRALASQHGLDDQLTFTGWVKDKAAFFDDIDLFVLPSHHEPFGIVLAEAMAYRTPLVTTDAEGPREIIRHGVDGLMVPRADAMAMADALQALLADPARAQQLAANAHARVEKEYSLAAMAARLQTALAPYI